MIGTSILDTDKKVFMQSKKRIGPSTDPWGNISISLLVQDTLPIETTYIYFFK